MDAHTSSLHEGVGITMTLVREMYWIPRLRYLTKRIIKSCYGWKRFQATPFPKPPVGNLPKDRTVGQRPFQVAGTDYAGPICYKKGSSKDAKAYILLIACSLTGAVHFVVLPDFTVTEFKQTFKKYMARRGRPEIICSDNAKTFCADSKWTKKIVRNEELSDILAKMKITWKFNLSRKPWCGGQFERLVGLMKQSMLKVNGNATLKWKELLKVILDVEMSPLTSVEDDVQQPVLTPNLMIKRQHYSYPSDDEMSDKEDLKRPACYLKRYKYRLWGPRERQNQKRKQKQTCPEIEDVVLVHGDSRNRGKWTVAIVRKQFEGRDGMVREVELQTPKSIFDRPVKLLYPLELKVFADLAPPALDQEVPRLWSPKVPEFRPRGTKTVEPKSTRVQTKTKGGTSRQR